MPYGSRTGGPHLLLALEHAHPDWRERDRPRDLVEVALARLGGIAATHELYAFGLTKELLRISVTYGGVKRVCRGWYAREWVHSDVLEARKLGGRLACVSALQHHGLAANTTGLIHVAVPATSSRHHSRGASHHTRGEGFVLHWHRIEPDGDRLSVSVPVARAQAARCRALGARDTL